MLVTATVVPKKLFVLQSTTDPHANVDLGWLGTHSFEDAEVSTVSLSRCFNQTTAETMKFYVGILKTQSKQYVHSFETNVYVEAT